MCVCICACEHTDVCKWVWVFAIWTVKAEQVTAGRKNNTGTFDWANMDKVVKEARSSVGQVSQKQKQKKEKEKKKKRKSSHKNNHNKANKQS